MELYVEPELDTTDSENVYSLIELNASKQELDLINSIKSIDAVPVSVSKDECSNIDLLVNGSKILDNSDFNVLKTIWKSDNESVATVDDNGVVTGKKQGKTTLTGYVMPPNSQAEAVDGTSLIKEVDNYNTLPKEVIKKVTAQVTVSSKDAVNINTAVVDKSADKIYTGKAITPTIVIKVSNYTLAKNEDYTVGYIKNTNAGIASVIITGKGKYVGTKTVSFKILPVSVSKLKVKSKKVYSYSGKKLLPKPIIYFGNKKLKEKSDYTISYKSNKKIGKAKIEIKGKGNFVSKKEFGFNIVPQKVVGIKISRKGTKAIITWNAAKGAKNYVVYYSKKKNGKYQSKVSKNKKIVIKKLKKKIKYYFYIRSRKKVKTKTYYGFKSKIKKS